MNYLLHRFRGGYQSRFRPLVDWLNGASDTLPESVPASLQRLLAPKSLFWGFWWGILVIIIALFCGQSSRFIYIDF